MSRLKNNRHRYDDALTRIDDREFERLLADFYRRQGWQVEHIGTGGTGRRFDGGVDLVLRRDDEVVLVQCKHWNVKQVPHNPVHELLGIMVNRGATGAILVTSGEFTRAAIDAATRNGHVRLINGHDLRDMLGELPEPAAPIGASRSRYRAANSRQEHGRSTRRPREVLIIKLVTAAIHCHRVRCIFLLDRGHFQGGTGLSEIRDTAATRSDTTGCNAKTVAVRESTVLNGSNASASDRDSYADARRVRSSTSARG
jgi:hypothetical protein